MTELRFSGQVVFPDGVRRATVVTEAGVIRDVIHEEPHSSDKCLIFPGFIDIHVHARDYARPPSGNAEARRKWEAATRKETFQSVGNAAVNGGVTLFAAMPNDPEPPSTPDSYRAKSQASSSCPCPIVLFASITSTSEPWEDLPYKVYLDAKRSLTSFASWKELSETLQRYQGCRVFFHAEDPEILGRKSSSGPRWRTRPPEAEVCAVDKILELTTKLALRTHICHVSTQGAVELIREHNTRSSVPVTCEVTPHHLFFSVVEGEISCAVGGFVDASDLLECNPPLRSETDRRFLVEALRDGVVDVLASDHAPHTLEDKRNGAPGMPHLDTLGAFAGWLMRECSFSAARIATILAHTPGSLLSHDLDRPQGVIEPGNWASFTWLDLKHSTLVQGAEIRERGPLQTRCGWSPFSGIALPAVVRRTIVRGQEYLF